jgi:uncharacterized membrane protein YecN with MAPEG domain
MMLTITPLYAGLLVLVYIALSALVVRQRVLVEMATGDADETNLNRSIRVHGNFVEYVPLGLILMLCAELQSAPAVAVHVMGLTLLIARVAHAVGMARIPQVRLLRGGGFLLTTLMLILSALAVIAHAIF